MFIDKLVFKKKNVLSSFAGIYFNDNVRGETCWLYDLTGNCSKIKLKIKNNVLFFISKDTHFPGFNIIFIPPRTYKP